MSRLPSIRLLLVALIVAGALLAAGTASASGEAIVRSSGPRTRPVIALTFDDGNSPDNCRRILAELVARRVPATFFPLAAAMALDIGFWRTVGELGYPVGDHTLTHPEMPTLTLAQQEWQIGQGRIVAEAILRRPLLRIFRPPYGAYDATTLVAAAAVGFPIALLWDVDTRDWARNRTVAQMLAAGELGRDGSVILMHCGPNATPYLVPQLIDYYRSRGFRFVTIPQLLGVAWRSGPTRIISPSTILDGLSPLPRLRSSGAITGPNDHGPPPNPSPTEAAVPSVPGQTDGAIPSPAVTQAPVRATSVAPDTSTAPSPLAVGPKASALVAPWLLIATLASAAFGTLAAAVVRRRRR
jgi:peptidoglycan/xylan/chitin deacetylase (PgdA/CDA1 family)